jgi:hypothetical protein
MTGLRHHLAQTLLLAFWTVKPNTYSRQWLFPAMF